MTHRLRPALPQVTVARPIRDFGLSREYLEGYEDGLIHGDVIGYQRAHDEWHARAEVSAAIAQQVARMGPADELEIRRGRPERAARLRQIMADRGITG